MRLMTWIREKLLHRTDAPKVDAAFSLTNEVIDRFRSLRQQLEPYRLSDDPLASITKKHTMARDYEGAQEERIHLGPK